MILISLTYILEKNVISVSIPDEKKKRRMDGMKK